MTIRSVTIYKTPLDNSYSNVVDFINIEQNRQDILFRLFDESYSYRYFQGLGRSIKRVGNSTLIVLPITYEEGRNYNYMIIEDDNQNLYFYFITNIVSENDSNLNPSSTFTLEWDVWNNNIEYFKDVPNSIIQKHYERFEPFVTSEEYLVRGFKPIYRVNNINLSLPKHSSSINFKRYIPAFFVLTLKENNTLPIGSGDINKDIPLFFKIPVINVYEGVGNIGRGTADIAICDSVNNKYNRNVVYIFAGIFDQDEEKFINSKIRGIKDDIFPPDNDSDILRIDYDIESYSTFGYLAPNIALNLPETITPFIDNITLTFHSPFYYIIDETTSEPMEIKFDSNPVIFWDYGQPVHTPWNPYIIVGDILNYRGLGLYEFERYITNLPERVYSFNYNETVGYYDILTSPSEFKRDLDLIDPLAYTSPFCDVFISYNNEYKKISISDNEKQDFKVTINVDSAQPKFNITSGGTLISSPVDLFVKNSGYFSFGVDSLQNFLLKNGKSLNLSVVTNILTGVVSAISIAYGNMSGIPGAIASFSNVIAASASVNESDRTPDEWFTNSGECDLKYQDRIKIVVDLVDRNNVVFREYMNNVYLYGYNFPSIDSPFTNSRISFDYVKTVNCDLSSLSINSNDIKKLEEIFNNGVTKWHIFQKNGNMQLEKNMIKDRNSISNYEIITETNTKLNEWLYGT